MGQPPPRDSRYPDYPDYLDHPDHPDYLDRPEFSAFPEMNTLRYPPCACPDPGCVLKTPANAPPDSPALARLRNQVRADLERRRNFGTFGRDDSSPGLSGPAW